MLRGQKKKKKKNIKQKQCCNKINKDFKNVPYGTKKILRKKNTKAILILTVAYKGFRCSF